MCAESSLEGVRLRSAALSPLSLHTSHSRIHLTQTNANPNPNRCVQAALDSANPQPHPRERPARVLCGSHVHTFGLHVCGSGTPEGAEAAHAMMASFFRLTDELPTSVPAFHTPPAEAAMPVEGAAGVGSSSGAGGSSRSDLGESSCAADPASKPSTTGNSSGKQKATYN